MVKLIVLDVDGVIVGNKKGVNFPYPSPKATAALKEIRQKGIPIILCSGKSQKALIPIIEQANLQNPHIVDSGAIIIDPLANKAPQAFTIDKDIISNLLAECLNRRFYTEMYTTTDYYIQRDLICDFTAKHAAILQKEAIAVDSLTDIISNIEVVKFMAFAMNEQGKKPIEEVIKPYQDKISFVWTMNPNSMPVQFGLVTSKQTSKALALTKVVEDLGIPFENTLGAGDTLGDWEYMNLCRFVATMEDANPQLKNLVKSKGEGKYFIAPSVDEDGILKIFEYFLSF